MQNLSNTDCGVFQMINHISNDSDCGVFAIAFAISLVYTLDLWIQISHDFCFNAHGIQTGLVEIVMYLFPISQAPMRTA